MSLIQLQVQIVYPGWQSIPLDTMELMKIVHYMHNQTSNETGFYKQSAKGMLLGRHLSFFHYWLFSFITIQRNRCLRTHTSLIKVLVKGKGIWTCKKSTIYWKLGVAESEIGDINYALNTHFRNSRWAAQLKLDTHGTFSRNTVIFYAAQDTLHADSNISEITGGQSRTSNMWAAQVWTLILTQIHFLKTMARVGCIYIYYDKFRCIWVLENIQS